MTVRYCAVCILFSLIFFPACSDELELTNGDSISGKILIMNNENVVIETEYGRLEIKRAFIKRGIFGDNFGNPDSTGKDNTSGLSENINDNYTDKGTRNTGESLLSVKIPGQGLVSELLFDSEFIDSVSTAYSIKNIKEVQFSTGIDGIENHAAASDGSGRYLVLSGQKKIDVCSSFTISCWLFVEDWEKTQYILSKWTSTNGDKAKGKFALYTKQGFVLCYIVDTTGSYHHIFTEKPIKLNEWNHIVVTYDTGTMNIYINNTIQAQKLFDIPGLKEDSSPLYILTAKASSGDIFSYYNLTGKLDNLRIYNRGLSRDEVESLFREKKE